jgi:hypothetical protein
MPVSSEVIEGRPFKGASTRRVPMLQLRPRRKRDMLQRRLMYAATPLQRRLM